LLDYDVMTKEGRENAVAKGLFRIKCKDFVVSAISILIKMGY